jgi:3-methyladenine DNA glycosylase AlkD
MKEKVLPKKLAKHAVSILKKHADPDKAQQGHSYFKEQVSILGISAGDLRQIARELFKEIQPHWTIDDAIALCEIMLPDKFLEVKGVSIWILERFAKSLKKEHLFLVKRWINKNYCDNWATIDHICPDIVSPIIGAHPDLIDEIIRWTDSRNRWLRRASAVSFIRHARQGKYIHAVHGIAKKLFPDQDDLVQKANGWLLRESGKTNMKRLESFLLIHGKKIPRTTLRYAIERYPEKKRKEILVKTRSK